MKLLTLCLTLMIMNIHTYSATAAEQGNLVPARSPIADATGASDSYVLNWCHDVRDILLNAQEVGAVASTAAEELTILKQGIADAKAVGNPRFQKFFYFTLNAALQDESLFVGDPERQAYLVRTYIAFAINDLDYLDGGWDPNDNGPYVYELVRRASGFGAMARTDEEEVAILSRSFQRAIQLIDDSDYRRTSEYACGRNAMANALHLVADPSLDSKTRVEILRKTASRIVGVISCP